MSTALRPFAVALVAAALAAPAQCTIVVRQDLNDLAKNSEAVVRAVVRGEAAAWDADRRFIWTTTTFDVVETWKGTLAGRASLRELGGEVGTQGMRVVGAPQYAAGEEVVLFLYKDAQGFWRTQGWTQGKFLLAADAERPGRGLAVASHAHVVAGFFKGDDVRGPLGVEVRAFGAKVKELIAAAAKAEAKPAPKTEGGK